MVYKFYISKIISPIPPSGNLTLTIDTDSCLGKLNEVNYLEHVQAFISLKASRRGDTVIFLTSPLGTRFDKNPIVLILLKFINFS